jgi:hypothetical protein
LQRLRDDLHEILERTAIRKQGCITLEVPSKDPFDYLPWLRMKRGRSMANRLLKPTGFFESGAHRGNIEDQLASLNIVRELVDCSTPETQRP